MSIKKSLALLLCAVMLLSLLTACGGKETPGDREPSAGEPAEGPGDAPEATQAPDDAGGADETAIPMGNESGFVMDLPSGYRYDGAWSCYLSESTGVKIWVSDANFYDTENEFLSVLEDHQDETREVDLGVLPAWVYEDPAGFYGAESHYCVSLSEYYQGKSGCHILVSHEAGDMAATQTQEILDCLKTIRMEGEAVGDREAAAAEANADPYESLVIDFTPAETAAMSTFISGGRYAVDGDSVFGQAFASDGTVEFVCIDLAKNGAFADVGNYVVLEKGAMPTYVTLHGDDVYYMHSDGGLYKISRDGGEPQLLISDAAAYLQIRGEKLYFCDENYTFCSADLDGGNVTPVLDKEVYYPYFINDQWMIYQDDADDESLHLRHARSGEDLTLCPIPGYSPVIYGTDLYFVASSNGDRTLAKIDMTYKPGATDNFGIEYGDLAEAADITISAAGDLYFGLTYGLHIDRWRDAENADGTYELFYRYLGESYELYWEFDENGRISAIYVTLVESGGSQSLPRFD
jgi:hypothetical protein